MKTDLKTFCVSGNYPHQLNACVGNNGGFNYNTWGYADGYLSASVLLFDAISKPENVHSVDASIYPACFLLRHGVELSIKHFPEMLQELGFPVAPDFSHQYHDMWKHFSKQYPATPKSQNKLTNNELAWMDATIEMIAKLDENSFVFRYPKARTGQPHLNSIVNLINVGDMHDQAKRMYDVFRKGAFHLKSLSDNQWKRATS